MFDAAAKTVSELQKSSPSSTISSFLIQESDIQLWVQTAVKTALPELEKPFREAFKKQDELLSKMLVGMDRNTQVMSETIALQGKLFISMGIAGFVIADKDWSRTEKLGFLTLGVGGFLGFCKLFLDG